MSKVKLFQIYFKEEQVPLLDPACEPLNNIDNPRSDLMEYSAWDKHHESIMAQDLDLWGFVSWKFKEKMGINGQTALDFINENPGHDVYLFNPSIINEALFYNSWEQGDIWHPNISDIGNKFMAKLGYADYKVKEVILDRNRTVYANYVVGNRNFWDKFMTFTRQLFVEADKDPEFKHLVFGAGLSQYNHKPELPMFTFLIERLLPTFIDINELDSIPYRYTSRTLPGKYLPYIDEISAISDLKVMMNKYHDVSEELSDELHLLYRFYRGLYMHRLNQTLGLE